LATITASVNPRGNVNKILIDFRLTGRRNFIYAEKNREGLAGIFIKEGGHYIFGGTNLGLSLQELRETSKCQFRRAKMKTWHLPNDRTQDFCYNA
jgi:hypothetical protein